MVNNFVLETTISAPFKSSPLTTYFRRLSWSPNGIHIAASNAVNGPVSSVAIIERQDWNCDISLIGHEGPTEVCLFSPRLFYTDQPPDSGEVNTGDRVTVIASAGQDKTLCVWNTFTSRPVVIVQDVTAKSVADLAWSPDGLTVFAASLDGAILAAQFKEGELGWPAKMEENDQVLEKFGANRKGMGIAEDVEGLHLESQSKAGESRAVESRMGALMGDMQPSEKDKAKGTNGTKSKSTFATTNGQAESEKEREKDKDKETATEAETPAAEPADKTADQAADRIKELKSRVTVGKDGKKRVAPLLVSSSGTGQSSLPQTQLVGSTATKAAQNEGPQTTIDVAKPYEGLPKGGIASLLLGNKRKAAALEDEEEEVGPKQALGPTPIVVNGVDGVESPILTAPKTGQMPTPEYLRPAILNPSIAYSQIRLGVPNVRTHVLRPLEKGVLLSESTLEDASRIPENIIFEARNPAVAKDPSRISTSKRGALIWQDFVPRAVLLVTGNRNFWAAACEDGTLYAWSPAGRRLFGAIVIESQPVILECRDHWLLCVTAVGLCHVWDIRTQSSPHPPVSLGPVLELACTSLNVHAPSPGPGITAATLNSTGHVVVTLTNGDGYFYARDMYTWQRLSEAWWAVGSQYWNSTDSSISALQSTAVGPSTPRKKDGNADVSTGILPFLERHTTNEFLLRGRAYTLQRIVKMVLAKDGFEGFESTVSIAHLENRIAGAMQLGAQEEFRLYLFMYAKRLGAEGLRGKVEELLNSLIGGVLREEGEKDDGKGWFSSEGDICGWDRKELLKGVVMILGKFHFLIPGWPSAAAVYLVDTNVLQASLGNFRG